MSITLILAIISGVSTLLAIVFGGKMIKKSKQHAKEIAIKNTQLKTREQEIERREIIDQKRKKENEKIKTVQSDINKLDDGGATDRLRGKWSRDKPDNR